MIRLPLVLALVGFLAVSLKGSPRFSVSFPVERSSQALDGRLLLCISSNASGEPRNQINLSPDTQMVFGVDVDGMKPGEPAVLADGAFGYPIKSLKDVPPGEYYVQALLNRYETFHRSDGHTVKLHSDQGEGQHWNITPGNFYSKPMKVSIQKNSEIVLSLTEEVPPVVTPKDTKYIRHVRIKSELLTKFWGRPVYLGAIVLVPEAFDEHTEARYPVMIFHDHFVSEFDNFRTEPPDAKLKPDHSERFHLSGYNHIQQEEAYKFYQQWVSAKFPRFLVVKIQHANPYYDDSYAVNSANLGPYGDAIETELMPYVEKQFRGIGQGWARFTYGGSTGGWEALAVQTFYPDHYNGAFAACPDPVDFHAYTVVNLYDDKNAYVIRGQHREIEVPAMHDYLGHVFATQRNVNYMELALGSKGRSGEQYDIWQAVFSPVGDDGYPKPIFDKLSGDIDPAIAAYWREHYDLTHIMERDWQTLGPKLRGKLHINVGSADTYYLNDAVYYLQEFLDKTTNPPSEAEVHYGDRAEHCWNGDPNLPNYLSRLHYNTMYLPQILKRMEKTAPKGADLRSWRY